MRVQMRDVDEVVRKSIFKVGIEYNIDNRIEVLANLAKSIPQMEELSLDERAAISMDIVLEIVRLRVEKELFGL